MRTGQLSGVQRAPQPSSNVRDYEYAKGQGYPGTFTEFRTEMRRAGAAQVNVGPTGTDYGKPPPGLAWKRDAAGKVVTNENGAPMAIEIALGPVAMKRKEAAAKKETARAQRIKYADVVTEDIDRVMGLITGANIQVTGLGSYLSFIPGTTAHDVSLILDTIKSNAGFDRLQEMRASSPTGGALGQVSDFENQLLQRTIGAVEQSMTEKELFFNLKRVKNIYLDIIHGPGQGPPREIYGDAKKEDAGWTVERIK